MFKRKITTSQRLVRLLNGQPVVSVVDDRPGSRSSPVTMDAEHARRMFHDGRLDWSFERATYCYKKPKDRR